MEGNNTPCLRIAQITDTHLYADPRGRLLGLDTACCLEKVVALASQRDTHLVVASGDLTHDASEPAYQRVRSCFSVMQAPVYCLPGNHDETRSLRRYLNSDGCRFVSSIQTHGWQMVFLDSTLAGSEGGHFSGDELSVLERALDSFPDMPTLVWLHHQPVHIGSRWLDTMAVDNPDEFFAVIDRHPQVRGIIWGHIHQAFEQRRNGVQLLATPSTCIQFLPDSPDFAIEQIPPGYRWLDLYADGHFETGVERLASIPGTIDLNARGY